MSQQRLSAAALLLILCLLPILIFYGLLLCSITINPLFVLLIRLGLFVWSGLLFWAIIAFFIAGAKGIPAMNDVTKLDAGRAAVGAFAFLLFFLLLIPVPHAFWESLGIHRRYV